MKKLQKRYINPQVYEILKWKDLPKYLSSEEYSTYKQNKEIIDKNISTSRDELQSSLMPVYDQFLKYINTNKKLDLRQNKAFILGF